MSLATCLCLSRSVLPSVHPSLCSVSLQSLVLSQKQCCVPSSSKQAERAKAAPADKCQSGFKQGEGMEVSIDLL